MKAIESDAAEDLAVSPPPPRLGRYEVAGLLATGGMAEIWLARVVGPFGFERVVVCKRIFPHLARQPEFVSMFVDEARIASGIQHPNVAQVHELVHEQGELFLVMEYLAGESLGSILRRLSGRGEALPPSLAAYIIAEACAGLHAAHELTDAQGFPRDLVHRDISPQNLFVTYSGQIKLLDFGIAKAADRQTRTEAGQVKGKFAYMSPEQCQGRPLDRRSDIFSMGIVLWESLSGLRLFARDSELLTFKAICDEPLPPLQGSAASDDALQQICTRALGKNRLSRFPTAQEFRDELLPLVGDSGHSKHPERALAELMEQLFAERIEAKRELLLTLQRGEAPASVPGAEVDESIDIPTLAAQHTSPPNPSHDLIGTQTLSTAPTGLPNRGLWTAAAVMALAVFGLFWAGPWSSQQSGTPQAAPESPSTPTTTAETAQPAAQSATSAKAAAGTVSFSVETTPAGARLKLGPRGALRAVGSTPTSVAVSEGEAPLILELSLAGYRTHSESLVPNMSQRVVVALQPEPPKSSARPGKRIPVSEPAKPAEPKPIPRFR
ncbi:MAG: protein kinase [Polyangiaceae bacterium]